MNRITLGILFFLCINSVYAQGTLDSEEVDVIRDYNPILADAVKVNIIGEMPDSESAGDSLEYDIPLTFYNMPYQPIRIKPVALKKSPQEDLSLNYLKAGFGTQLTPLAEVYINSKRSDEFQYGLMARYTSSKSNRENQQYSDLDVEGRTKVFFDKKYVLPINAWYRNDVVHYYGYQEPLSIDKDSVRQMYHRYGFNFEFANLVKNDFDIDYNLGAGYRGINSLSAYRQVNPYLNLSADKELKNKHKVGGGLSIDYYNFNGPIGYEETFTTLNLNYSIDEPGWSLKAAIDNTIAGEGKYYPIPNIDFSKDLIGDNLVFIAGVNGQLQRNNFSSLTAINPFLADSLSIMPTSQYEMYGGIRASTTGNWSFSAKGYYTAFNDMVFFVNSPNDSLRFDALYGGGSLAGVELESGYFVTDKIRLEAVLNTFTFNVLTGVDESWHTPTLNWRFSTQYQVTPKINAELDVFGLGKTTALLSDGTSTNIDGAIDINISGVYNFSNRFNVFLDLNNLAGFKYERFYNYPTYGFNLLGGISFSF